MFLLDRLFPSSYRCRGEDDIYTVSHVPECHCVEITFGPRFTKPPYCVSFPNTPSVSILAFFHVPHLFSSLYSVFLMTGNWGIDSSAVPPHSIPKATSGATRHIERSSSEIVGATANRSDDEGGGPAPLPSMKYANKVSNAEWGTIMLAKSKTDLRSAHPSSPKHTGTPINEQDSQSGVTGGGKSVTVTATHCRNFSRVACTHLRRIL